MVRFSSSKAGVEPAAPIDAPSSGALSKQGAELESIRRENQVCVQQRSPCSSEQTLVANDNAYAITAKAA
jgi:hypothetical protein